MKIEKIRKEILKEIKSYVAEIGWSENLFLNFSQSSNYKYEELISLFPNGKNDLIQMALDEINEKMTIRSKKINLNNLKVHERIRELIILRLKIMHIEKNFISKTFLHLLLPFNYSFTSKNLYKMADQVWFLAGDDSTDFNYYTKRTILGSIYTMTIIHFINSDNISETIKVLDKQLKRVSKIPKIKNKTKEILNFFPRLLDLSKKFSRFTR